MVRSARWTAVSGLAACLLFGTRAELAGQRPDERPHAPPERGTAELQRKSASASPAVSDRALAEWLLIENRGEIDLIQFALEKTSSDSLRQFAQQALENHRRVAQQLQHAAGTQTDALLPQRGAGTRPEATEKTVRRSAAEIRDEEAGRDEPDQRRAGTEDASEPRTKRQEIEVRKIPEPFHAGGASGADAWLAVKEQLSRGMVEAIKEELQDKQGAEFDLAFTSALVYRHLEQLNTLRVFEKQASPEFREVLGEAASRTEDHMERARTILREVEKQEESESSRPDRRARDPR